MLSSIPENSAIFTLTKGSFGKALLFEHKIRSLKYNCNDNNNYRSNSCIRKHLTQKLGCTLPWYNEEKNVRICQTTEDYEKFYRLRLDIYKGNGSLKELGCLQSPDCTAKSWERNVAFDLNLANLEEAATMLGHGNETKYEDLLLLQILPGSRDVKIYIYI